MTTPVNPEDRVAFVRESERENIWFLGDLIQPIITTDMSEGRFQVALTHSQPNSQPPLHYHDDEDEIFYILEGTMEFWAGSTAVTLGPHDCILMPKDVPHTFRADEHGAKWLVFTAPGGFDGFLRDVAIPADRPAPQPGWKMTEEIEERLDAAAKKHNIHIIAPPGTLPNDVDWKALMAQEQGESA